MHKLISGAALLLLGLVPGSGIAAETPPARAARSSLEDGRSALLEGKVTFQQEAGGQEITSDYQARLFVSVEREGEGAPRILAVRTLEAADEGEAFAAIDRGTVGEKGDSVEFDEPPLESEEMRGMLDLYFPAEFLPAFPGLLPAFPTPESGESRTSDETVSFFGLSEVGGRFLSTVKSEGERTIVERKLAEEARPEVKFNGATFVLEDWNEKYVIDRAKRVVRDIERAARFASQEAGVTLRSTVDLELTATADAGSEKLREVRKSLAAIDEAFDKKESSEKIRPEIEKLEEAVSGTPFEAVAEALDSRLEGYRRTFELSAEGRTLARLLGSKAPNFTLEDLDGKKVEFHDLIKNQVTLLSFWGVG